MRPMSKAFTTLLLTVFSISAGETVLQNSDSYSGCEDGYLSALFETEALINMIDDSLTNHFSEPDIYVSK